MKINLASGLSVEVGEDADGYPIIDISTGGGFLAERNRPAVAINLNGVPIHEMFIDGSTGDVDNRWGEGAPLERPLKTNQ